MNPIAFCFNDVSWDRKLDQPIPGSMAGALVAPILPHLETPHIVVDRPQPGHVNVYYTHREQMPPIARQIRGRETGVFVSHGIADKAWRNSVGSSYEYVFVSGPAWSKKMLEGFCPIHRIVEVGYAKLDPIFNGQVVAPDRDDRCRVIWAPTHGGGGMPFAEATERPSNSIAAAKTSWWDRDQILDALPESEFDVVIAPHPRHRPDRRSTLAEYVNADVVIADGGSTIYEAWALDLPVVFPDWLIDIGLDRQPTFEVDIYEERVGRHAERPEDLAALVEAAAVSGITGPEQEFVEPILPRSYRGRSAQMHAAALDEIATVPGAAPFQPTVTMVRYRHRSGREVTVPTGTRQERQYGDSVWWTAVGAA